MGNKCILYTLLVEKGQEAIPMGELQGYLAHKKLPPP